MEYNRHNTQQQKDALDDLSTELELAGEDEPILYVSYFDNNRHYLDAS